MRPLAKPKVIIFSGRLRDASKTFGHAPANAPFQFESVVAESRRTAALDLLDERIYLIHDRNTLGEPSRTPL
jgi:hypothetical protein